MSIGERVGRGSIPGGGGDAVLITGTSSGIGLETALTLAEQGFQVYATMRNLSRRGLLDAEAARRRVTVRVLPLDVTDAASIKAAVRTVVEQSGGIYGLVNNAGIIVRGYVEDLLPDEIARVFETNVFGTMAVTQAVLPIMRTAGRGRIVIMSSGGGLVAAPGNSAYCASKFALEGWGEALAQEAALVGVQVTLVEPGIIKTELLGKNRAFARRALDPVGPYYRWFQALERMADEEVQGSRASAEDVARAVYRALTARRPRLRYLVRFRAKALVALRRLLPGELFERIWFREINRRITQHPSPPASAAPGGVGGTGEAQWHGS